MAVNLIKSSSQWFDSDRSFNCIPPFAYSIWQWKRAEEAAGHISMSGYFSGTQYLLMGLRGTGWSPASNGAQLLAQNGSGVQLFQRSTIVQDVGVWIHVYGEYTSTSTANIYANGVLAQDNTSLDTVNFSSMYGPIIGAQYSNDAPSSFVDGYLAEAAIYKPTLSAGEIQALQSYSPSMVAPDQLVGYWPFLRDHDNRIGGGPVLTPMNGPTYVNEHPPIIYPSRSHLAPVVVSVPTGGMIRSRAVSRGTSVIRRAG